MKHHFRTKRLQELAAGVGQPSVGPSVPSNVRVSPETQLLWKVGELLSNSTEFDSVEGFAESVVAAPGGGSESMVPKKAPKPRVLPVEVLSVSTDPAMPIMSTVLDNAALEADLLGKRSRNSSSGPSLKKSKTVTSGSSGKSREDSVGNSDDVLVIDDGDDAADDVFVERSATVPFPPPAAASMPVVPGTGVVLEHTMAYAEWTAKRHRVMLASQSTCTNSVNLLCDLKPNFIILYDPDPGRARGPRLRVYDCQYVDERQFFRLMLFCRAGAGNRSVSELSRTGRRDARVPVGVQRQCRPPAVLELPHHREEGRCNRAG